MLRRASVIVDGGSTDGTVEFAQSYGLRVLQGKDSGIFDAINKGSFDSSGELLGFLGADDVMREGGLAAVVEAYRKSGRRWTPLFGQIRCNNKAIDRHFVSGGTHGDLDTQLGANPQSRRLREEHSRSFYWTCCRTTAAALRSTLMIWMVDLAAPKSTVATQSVRFPSVCESSSPAWPERRQQRQRRISIPG
jgi:glycosyltransferase involved in cell wall biosynthesis